jgi:hypothetical protein
MEMHRALSGIREMGDVLARARHSTCFRPIPIALTALMAVVASVMSPLFVESGSPMGASFVRYWIVIAGVNAMIVAIDLGHQYWRTDSELQRSKTRIAIYQFAPCIVIGAFATLCLTSTNHLYVSLLPGLWCMVVSLGMFATLYNAPPAMIFPAAYYAVVGGLYWRFNAWSCGLGPWSMGIAFGIGQAWIAVVLWRGVRDAR